MALTGAYEFLKKNKKLAAIIVSSVLAVLFIVSVLLAVFLGGEFSAENSGGKVMGLMRFNKGVYSTYYFAGDTFSYDTENSSIMCIVKDPESGEILKEEDLHPKNYGFRINGEGKVYDKAKDVIMTSAVEFISVTHKKYTSLKIDIPVKVYSSIDKSGLVDDFTFEAEAADLYRSGTLLEEEDKKNQPDSVEPFLSSSGTAKGENCSGGACLRSFKSDDMKVVFEFVCLEETEAELSVFVCKRPGESKKLSAYYDFTVNGLEVEDISEAYIAAGEAKDYFTPYEIKATVTFTRGINTIVFESGNSLGKKNPANLDAIRIKAEAAIIGGLNLLVA